MSGSYRRADTDPGFEALQQQNWWTPPDGDADDDVKSARANSLLAFSRHLENVQRDVHLQHLWNCQLYSNREMASFDWGWGNLYRASLSPLSRLGENLGLEMIEALVSQVGKNRPKATPVCRGASWGTRLAAKKLDKFLYGEFLRNDLYATGKQVFRDAAIFGFGCVEVRVQGPQDPGDPDNARTVVERVFPDEIIVDQAEVVATGRFHHVYRRRCLPVEVVAATYGIDEETLRLEAEESYLDYRPVGKGWVVVVEGYRLAVGKKPGRHVIAVKNILIKDEPWGEAWVPYVFYHYQKPVSGFYWPGAMEQILPHQVRINELNDVIRDAQDIMCRPRLLVAEGSRVNPYEIDNMVARIIKYTGTKPEAVTWPAISAELYNEREREKKICRAKLGLSETATTGQLPAGNRLDSSKAIREANSIQDDLLVDMAQRYEAFYLDVARRMVDVIRCSGAAPKTTWYVGGRKALAEQIDWAKIDLDRDAYVLQLEASSIYNLMPSGQTDELERQLGAGLITPEDYRRQVAHPDLDSEASIQAAGAEDIERVIDLLESGEYEDPEEIQDLVNGVQRVSLARLALRKYKGVPQATLDNFIDWLTAARAIMTGAAEATQPNPAPVPSIAGAMPTAMPGGMPLGPGAPAPAGPPMGPPGMPPGGPVPQ